MTAAEIAHSRRMAPPRRSEERAAVSGAGEPLKGALCGSPGRAFGFVSKLGTGDDWLDMFSGIGGSSLGLHAAGANVFAAANHSEWALGQHAANFPGTEHFRADLVDPDAGSYVHPHDLPRVRRLWASPSCTHHSPANAEKRYRYQPGLFDPAELHDPEDRYAGSERSRVTMVCPLLYAQRHRPDHVVIENVVEAAQWGPNRDGTQFRDWLNRWATAGYQHEVLFLNSGFFPPVPQSRDRMYVVFWRKGLRRPDLRHRPEAWCHRCDEIVTAGQAWKPTKRTWPLPQWGKYGSQYTYACLGCGAGVVPLRLPAASVIDWSDLGGRIGDREKPLAPRTIRRIRRCVTKFAGFPPVLVDRNGDARLLQGHVLANRINGRGRHHTELLPTAVGSTNNTYLASLVKHAGNTYERPGQVRGHSVTDQTLAFTATLEWALMTSASVATYRGPTEQPGVSAVDPIGTIATHNEHGLVALPGFTTLRGGEGNLASALSALDQVGTISAGGQHHSLVVPCWVKNNGDAGDTAPHGVHDPFGTFTAHDTTSLVAATIPLTHGGDEDRARHIMAQLATLTSARERYLAAAEHLDPEDVDIDNVRFRMLKVDTEVRAGMGFPAEYLIQGTQEAVMAGLGNAVTPPVAAWIHERIQASMDDPTGVAS